MATDNENEPANDPQDSTPSEPPVQIPSFPDNDWVKGDYTGIRDPFPTWRRTDRE